MLLNKQNNSQQGGLLSNMGQPQPSSPQQAGGLLGNMQQMPQSPSAPPMSQGQSAQSSDPLKMLSSLAQNPTPQMADQIIALLMQKGTPEAKQMAQALNQMKDSPEAVKSFADNILQSMGGNSPQAQPSQTSQQG